MLFPAACSVILLVAAFTNAAGRPYGWIVVLTCFVAGAAFPLTYTVILFRERRLYLREKAGIEENRDRVGVDRLIGWALGVCLLAVGVGLGGVSKAVLLAVVAGVAFGLWPGLLANFLRLRRENHWG